MTEAERAAHELLALLMPTLEHAARCDLAFRDGRLAVLILGDPAGFVSGAEYRIAVQLHAALNRGLLVVL